MRLPMLKSTASSSEIRFQRNPPTSAPTTPSTTLPIQPCSRLVLLIRLAIQPASAPSTIHPMSPTASLRFRRSALPRSRPPDRQQPRQGVGYQRGYQHGHQRGGDELPPRRSPQRQQDSRHAPGGEGGVARADGVGRRAHRPDARPSGPAASGSPPPSGCRGSSRTRATRSPSSSPTRSTWP